MPRFNALKIKDVRRETPEAVSIAFDIPEELQEDYRFVPGQYLTLRTQIDGEDVRRSYSICSGLDDGEIRVAVKKVEGGLFSSLANDNLAIGMTLDVMSPMGRFTATPEPSAARHYVAFAAGSGVTPILAIVKTLLGREPNSSFTFFYGNRSRASVIFLEALEDLKDTYMDRFTLVHVLSQEGQDIDIVHGRLDGERIKAFAKAGMFSVTDTENFFICGPGTMMDEGKDALIELGVSEDKIRTERFVSNKDKTVRAKAASTKALQVSETGVAVEAVLDGARRKFMMTAEDDSVITAAHRQGIELPFSCKGGMCCTCRAKVVEGEVEMASNYSLEPWELEAGFVLTCQTRPLGEGLILDFDDM